MTVLESIHAMYVDNFFYFDEFPIKNTLKTITIIFSNPS